MQLLDRSYLYIMAKPGKNDIAFAATMSFITTFFVSFVLVTVNLGFRPAFLFVWLRTWGIAFVMVTLAILFLAPRIRRMFQK